MSESKVINDTAQLVTRQTLVRDLRELGVEPGMTLLVHASLSSLGWVCGGAQAVVMALQDAVGSGGTLVMPAHTSGLSDPAPPLLGGVGCLRVSAKAGTTNSCSKKLTT